MGISVEWIINKAKQKIYAVSHAKAVIRGDHTVDDDLTKIETSLNSHKDSEFSSEKGSHGMRYFGGKFQKLNENNTWEDVDSVEIPESLPADGGNSDTVDGLHDINLFKVTNSEDSIDCDNGLSTGIYFNTNFLNYPAECADGQGILIVYNYLWKNTVQDSVIFTDTDNAWIKEIFITPHSWVSYTRSRVANTWSEWQRIENGNADTVDDLHASDFSQNRVLSSSEEVDNADLESGIYSVEEVNTRFPYGGSSGTINPYFVLIVNKHRKNFGYGSQIAIPYNSGQMVGVFYRNCANGTWNSWKNVADGGNADTVDGLHTEDFKSKIDVLSEDPSNPSVGYMWITNS